MKNTNADKLATALINTPDTKAKVSLKPSKLILAAILCGAVLAPKVNASDVSPVCATVPEGYTMLVVRTRDITAANLAMKQMQAQVMSTGLVKDFRQAMEAMPSTLPAHPMTAQELEWFNRTNTVKMFAPQEQTLVEDYGHVPTAQELDELSKSQSPEAVKPPSQSTIN